MTAPLRVWAHLPSSPVSHRLTSRHDPPRSNAYTTECGIWLFGVVVNDGPPSRLCQRCVGFISDRRREL